jgi:hypothetical protein
MEKLIKYLWGAFLFVFPFSVRFLVYERASYRFGNFNPWVTGFVYLPEVLLIVIFLLWYFYKLRVKSEELRVKSPWLWVLLLLFTINIFVITLLKGDPLFGAVFVLRVFEALIIFWLIADKILNARRIVTILLFGALFQILLGYAQIAMNHSLGLKILGESVIGPNVAGVAKIDITDTIKQIRPYGTFLHPNILAAYLLIVFFVSLKYLKYGSKLFWGAIFIWGVYLTHSRAAMIVGAICLGISFLFTASKAIPFRRTVGLITMLVLVIGNFWFFQKSAVVDTRDASWKERLSQNVISKNMWAANPFGVGVSNYTLEMERYSDCGSASRGSNGGSGSGSDCVPRKYLPWEFQPVHNTYFLILNEAGIQGLLFLLAFLLAFFDLYWKDGKAVPIFALLLLAPFDHFLWDSWVGFMLVAFVAGFFALENHRESVVEKVEHAVHHEG